MVVYYRAWIEEFAIVAAPLFKLQRKEVLFKIGADEMVAVETLKEALIEPPILIVLDYSEGAG